MASQTITGDALQFTQDNKHCFAFSGQLDDVANVYTSGLLFTTGAEYILGEFQFDPAIKISEIATGDITVYKILLNDTPVSITKLDGGQEDMPSENTVKMLLPPHTKVEVKYHGGADSADYPMFLRFIGRVYEYLPVRN